VILPRNDHAYDPNFKIAALASLSAPVPRLLAILLAAGMLFLPAMLLAGMGIRPTLLPARFAIWIVLLARIQTLRIVWWNVRIIHGPAP
jgi:hypothetical protein